MNRKNNFKLTHLTENNVMSRRLALICNHSNNIRWCEDKKLYYIYEIQNRILNINGKNGMKINHLTILRHLFDNHFISYKPNRASLNKKEAIARVSFYINPGLITNQNAGEDSLEQASAEFKKTNLIPFDEISPYTWIIPVDREWLTEKRKKWLAEREPVFIGRK